MHELVTILRRLLIHLLGGFIVALRDNLADLLILHHQFNFAFLPVNFLGDSDVQWLLLLLLLLLL
jgi:hypothetical protein